MPTSRASRVKHAVQHQVQLPPEPVAPPPPELTKVVKRKQKVGGPYCGPYGPSPVAHVAYSAGRHMHPERFATTAASTTASTNGSTDSYRVPMPRKREKAVSVRIIDVSLETITSLQKVSESIKRLIAANLRLKAIPDELLASLLYLTKLDLSNNSLTDGSFPESMKKLEHLMEIRLGQNGLTKVPACLKKLKNLARLDMSENQLETISGLDKLRKLQSLVLDSNKLTSVFKDISTLKRLEVLRCSRNSLKEIPRNIRQLKALVDLDVSDNRISILPTDIFMLPKLDVFNASQNQIAKVPSFNVRPQNKHWVNHIDLSDNRLAQFPGHLLQMTSKLDLSGNKIKTLPYHSIKKLDVRTSQQLVLDDNPLAYPPAHVCSSGLKNVISFFQESQAEIKVYQGVKVLIVGPYGSGKTSLVQTLVDQQPRMSEEIQDTSGGIDTYEVAFDLEEADTLEGRPGKSLELSIWDFCGHPFYMYPHYVFFEQPTITILTFNMAAYKPELFEEQIGCWFDWMIAKTNKIVVILVGTQCDQLSKGQITKVTREVRAKLTEHIERQTELTKSRIRAIEEREHISPTLSEQLKAYMKLLQARYTVQTDVICTSARKYVGLDRLRQAIESLAGDRQLFPNVMRVIPTFWLDVQHYIEDRGNALSIPVLKWEEFVEEVTSRFGMKHLMKAIAQYLHETGQIMWFSNIESLKGLVFIRPSWLFDVFRSIFRHDFEDATFTPDDNLRAAGLSSIKFERLKQEALSDGVIDRDLLRCLLSPLIPADLVTPATEVMRLLTEGFELGYSVTKRQRDSVFSLAPDTDSEGKAKLGKILLPWLRRSAEPDDFRELWDETDGNRKLAVYFRFPHYFPPGLFEIISVRAYKPGHSLRFKHHWGGGFHAVHATEKVHVVVSYAWVEDNDGRNDRSNGRDDVGKHSDASEFNKDSWEHDRVVKRVRTKKVVVNGKKQLENYDIEDDDFAIQSEEVENPRTNSSEEIHVDPDDVLDGNYTHVGVQKGGETEVVQPEAEPEVESDRRKSHVMLKYEVRDQSSDEAELTPAAAMWTLLLPLLMEVEELLNAYPGILVERFTECPLCRSPAFLGEWLTPKETQALPTRPCEACGQDVDTAFLVQPREKKRVIITRKTPVPPPSPPTPPPPSPPPAVVVDKRVY
ncbi:malignant fibrous histiocytoma-amplified sequence 1-like [Elysia marginata]|uniref:Malignant fibrous histiocytoma-amplified sequence 1-like n=1 Tax=Elysia marginata TaxID=1093978 RepID=A0AAV4IV27_9GAST|nr:malignant fibrous histiocytoma-amplified sequence 1-like [Elysia marginata]